MAVRYPIEYELDPTQISPGNRWLILRLKNVGVNDLTALDVKLNSTDTYSLNVSGTGLYVVGLHPSDETKRAFQVLANLTGRLYVTIDGWRNGEAFHWESPGILVTVGDEVAELVSVYAMTEPYPSPGERIRCEARVRGLDSGERLRLEFWSEEPNGELEPLAELYTEPLEKSEEQTLAAEFTPEEPGSYRLHAYLYQDARRIGYETDHVYVQK